MIVKRYKDIIIYTGSSYKGEKGWDVDIYRDHVATMCV